MKSLICIIIDKNKYKTNFNRCNLFYLSKCLLYRTNNYVISFLSIRVYKINITYLFYMNNRNADLSAKICFIFKTHHITTLLKKIKNV